MIMDVVLEYYVLNHNNRYVLLGNIICSDYVANDPVKRMELGRHIGIDGWNVVVCGALKKHWLEGNGYRPDSIYLFIKDDEDKKLALQFVKGFDNELGFVAPKVRGYSYIAPVVDETPVSNEDMLGGFDSVSGYKAGLMKKTKGELCEMLGDECDMKDTKNVMINKLIDKVYE